MGRRAKADKYDIVPYPKAWREFALLIIKRNKEAIKLYSGGMKPALICQQLNIESSTLDHIMTRVAARIGYHKKDIDPCKAVFDNKSFYRRWSLCGEPCACLWHDDPTLRVQVYRYR